MPPINEEQKTLIAEKQQKKWTWRGFFKEVLIFAAIVIGIIIPFRVYVAEPYIVSGASMEPTFDTGDYLIVDKLSHRFRELRRNSVVIFKIILPGTTGPKNLIKRVIGLPGDTITISGTTVRIKNTSNPEGFELNQSYVKFSLPSYETVVLKDGQYFVMGDNRAESYDSRSWGILPKSDILGEPIIELLPISKISIWPGDYSNF